MKKLKSVLNGYLGNGKPRYLATFPRIFWDLHSLILPKKFTMKGGEGTITALENPIALAFSRRRSTRFDITKTLDRRKYPMKTKTLTKKLVLNKSTITNLSNGDMKEAYGGVISEFVTICIKTCVTMFGSVCFCD